jgi:peptide/nickel transport system ATP-binding protein
MTGQPLLQVSNLSVRVGEGAGAVAALSGVDLSVAPGEVVGLVGESGGGKTMLARSIIRALPETARADGAVRFDGVDVLGMTPGELRRHRGGGAAMCFQNPRSALSPVRTVGRQLTDRIEVHQRLRGAAARQEAVRLLAQVGIRDPERRFGSYPHEMSGGMAQRVMIALALACTPRLLLADEPTTGLDATLVREILGLFRKAADDGLGVLLISHDLASVAAIADRVAVLYAGTIVEAGPAGKLLSEPAHPYTRALLRSVPDLDGVPVRATRGAMPLLRQPPASCPFAPRCESADDTCRAVRPPLTAGADGWQVACFHPVGGHAGPAAPAQAGTAETAPSAGTDPAPASPAEQAPEVPCCRCARPTWSTVAASAAAAIAPCTMSRCPSRTGRASGSSGRAAAVRRPWPGSSRACNRSTAAPSSSTGPTWPRCRRARAARCTAACRWCSRTRTGHSARAAPCSTR